MSNVVLLQVGSGILACVQYNLTAVSDDDRYTHYQKNGNIACFNVGAGSTCSTTSPDYSYHPDHKHAVEYSKPHGTSADRYTYDVNGSVVGGPDGRVITWTTFNKPRRIEQNTGTESRYAEFSYDANRARYKQVTDKRTIYGCFLNS